MKLQFYFVVGIDIILVIKAKKYVIQIVAPLVNPGGGFFIC